MSQGQISDNARRWLQTIRFAEGTAAPSGYSTTFGYGSFDPSKGHPRRVNRAGGYASDAAGAYQFLSTTWDAAARGAGVDARVMSPENQDRAALYLIRKRGVDPDQPISPDSVAKLAPEWASLPTKAGRSYYGQPVKGYNSLVRVFGGKVDPAIGSGGGGAAAPAQASGGAAATEGAPVVAGGGGDGGNQVALLALLGSANNMGRGGSPLPAMGGEGEALASLMGGTNTAAQNLLRQQTEALSQPAMLSTRRAQLEAEAEQGRGSRRRMAGSPGRNFLERLAALSQPLLTLA